MPYQLDELDIDILRSLLNDEETSKDYIPILLLTLIIVPIIWHKIRKREVIA